MLSDYEKSLYTETSGFFSKIIPISIDRLFASVACCSRLVKTSSGSRPRKEASWAANTPSTTPGHPDTRRHNGVTARRQKQLF